MKLRLTIIAWLLLCTAAEAALFIIEFKSGREYETTQYRFEVDTLWFHTDAGPIGVPVDKVKKIRKTVRRPRPQDAGTPSGADILEQTIKKLDQGKDEDKGPVRNVPPDQAVIKKFEDEVKAYEQKYLKDRYAMTKAEKWALLETGVALKDRLAAHQQVQHLTPLIAKLHELLTTLEGEVSSVEKRQIPFNAPPTPPGFEFSRQP
jgi:hypothetical protein